MTHAVDSFLDAVDYPDHDLPTTTAGRPRSRVRGNSASERREGLSGEPTPEIGRPGKRHALATAPTVNP